MAFARLKNEQAQYLREILQHAARMTDLTPCQVGLVMSFFLDDLAWHVGEGNIVVIPGFGTFMAVGYDIPTKKGKMIQRDKVAFVSAPPHKRLLRPEKHEDYTRNVLALRRRRRNISSSTFRVKKKERVVEEPVCSKVREAFIALARRRRESIKPQF